MSCHPKGSLVLQPTRAVFGGLVMCHSDKALALFVDCKLKTDRLQVLLSFSASSTPVNNDMEPRVSDQR